MRFTHRRKYKIRLIRTHRKFVYSQFDPSGPIRVCRSIRRTLRVDFGPLTSLKALHPLFREACNDRFLSLSCAGRRDTTKSIVLKEAPKCATVPPTASKMVCGTSLSQLRHRNSSSPKKNVYCCGGFVVALRNSIARYPNPYQDR
ncbi:hypothetical protein TNIN_381371 [Trichonephila inaurata madagascariensis]|uniref:Uncharacterized protein n=1 Tax=Trichonephila inaurata madagascariensis TaxID=2747483 RepID=A0A8X6Y6N6_9ARAC|nr:hypothetical protein TNIN_381371 [Trichonephila inaurata madagascariensis]